MIELNEKLIDAVYDENLNEAIELLNQGADINYVNDMGITPLTCAIRINNASMTKFVLEKCGNPNPDSQQVYPLPLHEAIDTSVQATNYNASIPDDSTEIIELLLKYGADIFLKDRDGESAYDFAKGYHEPAFQLFQKVVSEGKV